MCIVTHQVWYSSVCIRKQRNRFLHFQVSQMTIFVRRLMKLLWHVRGRLGNIFENMICFIKIHFICRLFFFLLLFSFHILIIFVILQRPYSSI